MIKTLLWDFDNTLGYRDGMWTATMKELLDYHGFLHVSTEEIEPLMQGWYPWSKSGNSKISHTELFRGKSWWEYINENINRVLLELKIPKESSDRITAEYREAYLNRERWNLFPDTLEALKESQKRGFKNYIFSNHTPELEELVDYLGLSGLIDRTISSAMLEYEKPHLKFYSGAMALIGEDPKNSLMIGDNYFADVEGARAFGMEAVLVHSENTYNYPFYSTDLMGIFRIMETIQTY